MRADCKESEIRMHKSVKNDFKIGELLNPLEKKNNSKSLQFSAFWEGPLHLLRDLADKT